MSSRVQGTLAGQPVNKPQTRKSYTREYKLEVVRFYHEHNLYQTSKRFSLNTKTIGRWVADKEKIKKSKKASKRVKYTRRCQFPEVEEELYREYKKLRKQGFKVKGFWFKGRAKQILHRMNPDASFLFSDSWFDGFKSRHRISLRRPTNVCQKPAADKREAIQQFHRAIRKIAHEERPTRAVGRFMPRQIAAHSALQPRLRLAVAQAKYRNSFQLTHMPRGNHAQSIASNGDQM